MQGGRAWRFGSVAILVAAAAHAAPAAAVHVGCGDRITTDTTLDSDLAGCPGSGVIIAASGVTLDLGGHTVTGSDVEFGVSASVPGVTVENGVIGRFQSAVSLSGGAGHVMRDLTVFDSHDGLRVHGVDRAVIERVTAWGNDGSGITAAVSRDVTLSRSFVHDNAGGVGGVGLEASALVGNTVERNTFYGIRWAEVDASVFEDNLVRDNGEIGIGLEEDSTGNRVAGNRVTGIDGDGIALSADSGANKLERNRADRNRRSGFAILGGGATLIRNTASRNGALGFDAPAGASLAERNKARHNADPRQCVGIFCR